MSQRIQEGGNSLYRRKEKKLDILALSLEQEKRDPSSSSSSPPYAGQVHELGKGRPPLFDSNCKGGVRINRGVDSQEEETHPGADLQAESMLMVEQL